MTNQQVAFAVRQRKPKTLDDAVAHTLELESYLKGKPAAVVSVVDEQAEVAAIQARQDPVMEVLQSLVQRMDRLRLKASASYPSMGKEPPRKQTGKQRGPIVCHRCGKEGHFARGCAASHQPGPPGN